MHMDDQMGRCDGCGALVPLDELSITAFIELDGFTCEECRHDTVVGGPLSAGERT